MSKKKKKNKKVKRKINVPLLLSIIAILISIGQLIFTFPFVLKKFDRVDLQAMEFGIAKPESENLIKSSFLIMNTGNNTVENVELHMRVLQGDRIMFVPDIFNHVKGDNQEGLAGNLYYKCDKIVPGEKVRIYVFSDYKNYLKTYELDTLVYNKRLPLHKYSYGPRIVNLKHSLDKVEIQRQKSILLRKLNY